MRNRSWYIWAVALTLAGCAGEQKDASEEITQRTRSESPDSTSPPGTAVVLGGGTASLSPEELEQGRLDPAWKRVVQLDSIAQSDTTPNSEKWENISASAVNQQETHLPLGAGTSGPSVLKVQILLDRVKFSPGIIDGYWGKNTEKAIYWLQKREGLPATGRVDRQTFDRLVQLAGRPRQLVRTHTLSAEDVEGPFVKIPDDIYEQAKLECMCYESLSEKLVERFHTSREILEQLNPEARLDSLQAGDTLRVPHIRTSGEGERAKIDRLVVSDAGFYLHALDASGRIVYHFPTTLGSDYEPSPQGDYKVVGIARDPEWYYQPKLLADVPDEEEDAMIPAGPNNAVGIVWIELSKPHYGIHGTSAPESIGYTTSAGCVRMTNWDVRFLSERISAGIPVQFRDVNGESRSG